MVVLFAFFLALTFSLHTFGVQQAWVARYSNGSNTISQAFALALDQDGNVYVAGHSTRTNAPFDYDYIVIKYNSLGVQQWANRHGSAGVNDQVQAMVVSTNGDVFLTGSNETVKYFTSGLRAWSLPYAGRDIVVDTNGNSYVTGFSQTDFATVKLDPSGSNVWLRTWDRAGLTDWSKRVAVDQAGNVFVGGMAMWHCDGAGCYSDPYILKYNSNGTPLWTNLFNHGAYSIHMRFHGFACDTDSNLYLAFAALGSGVCCNWNTAKIAANGELAWFYSLGRSVSGIGVRAMALDVNANLYYTGYSYSYKITAQGTNVWSAQYEGRGNAIAADAAGNAYVAAQSIAPSASATIKYGPNGQQLWSKRYTEAGYSEDQPYAIAVSPNGDVYVTGFSNPSPGTYEITTIKYVQLSPIEKRSNGNILLSFCGTPGSNYVIEACTTLTNWSPIATNTASPTGLYTFEDTNAPSFPQRFYRTKQE